MSRQSQRYDQIGHGGGGGNGLHYDIIGRAFAQADAVGGAVTFDQVGQRGGGGMRGGGMRGGGFRGGFRGGRGGRVVTNFANRRAIDVVPWWPWWGASWWPYSWANTYTGYPQQFSDACAALGRAVAQGAPQATIDALRAQCAQLVYTQPVQAAAPAYGYGYGAWPFGTPGYLAY